MDIFSKQDMKPWAVQWIEQNEATDCAVDCTGYEAVDCVVD